MWQKQRKEKKHLHEVKEVLYTEVLTVTSFRKGDAVKVKLRLLLFLQFETRNCIELFLEVKDGTGIKERKKSF